MKHLLLPLLLLLLSSNLGAQQTLLISKEEVLLKVREHNNTIEMSQQDVLMAKGDFNQTHAVFLPHIAISHTGLATTNPLMAFGSKLNQGILTQGDFNPDLLNNPNQIEDYATRIEVQQPLLNLDGHFQRKAAKSKLNAAELNWKRTQSSLDLEVDKTYMQLQLAYKSVDVLKKAKRSAIENLLITENNFQEGNLQKSEVLMMKVRLTEIDNQLQYAKSNIRNVSNYLSVLMDNPSDFIFQPADSLIISNRPAIQQKVPESRADILAMTSASEAYHQMYRADKMSFLPDLNAFGSYELHDQEVFGTATEGYLFGATLKWDLFEGGKRFGKTKKSKAEYEKSRLQLAQYRAESQLELNRTHRMFEDAKNNLSLAKLAMEHSKESLRIRTNRFEEGLERTADLLLAETQYAQKQLEYYTMVFNHNHALAYLDFLTKDRPLIQDK